MGHQRSQRCPATSTGTNIVLTDLAFNAVSISSSSRTIQWNIGERADQTPPGEEFDPWGTAPIKPEQALLRTARRTMSSPYYKPGLPAFYNDFDLRHVNGASVVFGAGGQVQCIKLAKDYSAIRMDGLGPHQFNPAWVKSALKKLGISEVAKFGPRFDDDTYTQYMVVVAEDPHFARIALARLQGLTPKQRLESGLLYVRLSETRLGLEDIDPIMPPALTSPICRPRYRGQCSICTDDLDEDRFVGACGHSYCLGCFSAWVSHRDTFARSGVVFCDRECRSHVCDYEFSLAEMKEQLDPEVYDRLLLNSADEAIRSCPQDFRFCPHAGCNQVNRPTPFDPTCTPCSGCEGIFCTSCGEAHDDAVPCTVDEKLMAAMDEMGFRDCPGCRTPMGKNGGCNHMECGLCHTHFCWVCMEMGKTGDDVYHHMQRVHGTFDGVHFINENGELIANPEEIEAQRAALDEVDRRRRDGLAEEIGDE
ncbi:hypothetical protein CPLU01_12904 [Colletotrichum plurivorum]|uniref:RBR-type E3 ubiquitin transferase n=1 Tax=Colletotrichum plurivorum TaxID=2175906 RepID=A0A8H6JVJ3_9PEZI|nr:hypothetical protein CPLU01_12904 [Colletotrichum plurivorum]